MLALSRAQTPLACNVLGAAVFTKRKNGVSEQPFQAAEGPKNPGLKEKNLRTKHKNILQNFSKKRFLANLNLWFLAVFRVKGPYFGHQLGCLLPKLLGHPAAKAYTNTIGTHNV